MATLLRFSRQGRVVITRLGQCQGPTCLVRPVSTTKKGRDLTNVSVETFIDKSQELKVLEEHFSDADPNKLKNWVSSGHHMTDRDADRFINNCSWFILVSFLFVTLHFSFYYKPDFKMKDWVTREAYLEMERREKAGLPIIDPYLIPPDQVVLPTDEELGNQEIII